MQDTGGTKPRVLSFSQHDLPIDLPALEEFRQRGGNDREYILPELLKIGWAADSTEAERRESRASFNYRMVEVVMMVLLPLLALSLAIPPKRSTSSLGVFVSIVMVVAYHKINQYGQDVAALGRVDPILALWGPFLLLAALIIVDVLPRRLRPRRPGDRRARSRVRQDRQARRASWSSGAVRSRCRRI